MTIVWISGGMQGLAADSKPTTVPTNTSFFETDTGLSFNFNGSTWDPVGGGLSVTTSNGTYVHSNVTTEETVLEITNNVEEVSVSYDVSLLAQNTVIRVKEEMDGVTSEIQSERTWPTDFAANLEAIVIRLEGRGRDQIITFQSLVLEGATRDIPWSRRDVS